MKNQLDASTPEGDYLSRGVGGRQRPDIGHAAVVLGVNGSVKLGWVGVKLASVTKGHRQWKRDDADGVNANCSVIRGYTANDYIVTVC